MNLKKIGLLASLLIVLPATSFNEPPLYKNPNASVSARVDDLLSRMTIEEKVAQMLCVWNDKNDLIKRDGKSFDVSGFLEKYPHGIGQVGRPYDALGGLTPEETVSLTNAIQKYAMESTRLGVPVMFHAEALHGYAAKGATSFPQPIALASTFNAALVKDIYELVAREVRLSGSHLVLSPVVDVARDPRWGRVEETFGEDPYLVGEMGLAAVRGFQGDSINAPYHVLSTLKHLAGHGQPESGTNIAPANYSERIIREIFLYPFKKSVIEGDVCAVMASYNEIDGVPSHVNKWLLRDILRGEWNFDGFVVSDYYALRELYDRPGLFGQAVAENEYQAAELAIKAGINIELPEPDIYPHIIKQVKKGNIDIKTIDELVGKMLAYKFKLGLFEQPYLEETKINSKVGSVSSRQLALEAARQSIVLLKNKNKVAPLDLKKIEKIAVIGPNASRSLLGGYSGVPNHDVTVLGGIKERAGKEAEILYHEGCKITVGGSWDQDEVVLASPDENRKMIREAVSVAKKADVIVLALGGNEQTSREAWAANHMGDRTDLQMVGQQDELVNALSELGKPMISFLFNGKPLAVTNLAEKSDALFECWYIGQETGLAVADVLFGNYNPGGKLPITIPRSVGHIPAYYNYKPSARRGYLFDDISPLFAFGYGLSYTSFEIGNLKLDQENIAKDGEAILTVSVKNTGKLTGEEVVQLYIRDKFSSVTRPVKELKGFQRILLNPGESREVQFKVGFEQLAFYDINMNYTVESGEFKLMAGNSSNDSDLKQIILNVD